jgi:hypothetical protein
MRDKFSVYLAGGIKGFTIKEATQWRVDFEKLMLKEVYRDASVEVINPMRRIRWEGEQDDVITVDTASTPFGISTNQIVHRDLADVARCDVLMVELSKEGWNYLGTIVEVAYAHFLNKPIIIWSGWAQNDPFLSNFATKILPDMESCFRFIMDYLY